MIDHLYNPDFGWLRSCRTHTFCDGSSKTPNQGGGTQAKYNSRQSVALYRGRARARRARIGDGLDEAFEHRESDTYRLAAEESRSCAEALMEWPERIHLVSGSRSRSTNSQALWQRYVRHSSGPERTLHTMDRLDSSEHHTTPHEPSRPPTKRE